MFGEEFGLILDSMGDFVDLGGGRAMLLQRMLFAMALQLAMKFVMAVGIILQHDAAGGRD